MPCDLDTDAIKDTNYNYTVKPSISTVCDSNVSDWTDQLLAVTIHQLHGEGLYYKENDTVMSTSPNNWDKFTLIE